MIQAAILILSAAAMWLVSGRSQHARFGWALGLASQPFWLYATFEAGQWGMFALAVFYSFAWANGLWNYGANKDESRRLKTQVAVAKQIVQHGVSLMTKEQLGQWRGVRSFLEQPEDYEPSA